MARKTVLLPIVASIALLSAVVAHLFLGDSHILASIVIPVIRMSRIPENEKGKWLYRFLAKGMSKKQVIAILGEPDCIQGHGPVGQTWATFSYWRYELTLTFDPAGNLLNDSPCNLMK
jgi:hypothetical protein